LVLLAYLILLPVALLFFPPAKNIPGFFVRVLALNGVLIAICFWKGEAPKWRWGREREAQSERKQSVCLVPGQS